MRLVALLVLVPAIAHADVLDEKGARAGTVFTGLNHDASQGGGGSKPDFGLALGTFITLRASPWFAFQLEAQLDMQRFELHMSDDEPIGRANAWFVELPALARFDTLQGDRTKLYLVAGPSLVLSAGGEIDLDAGGTAAMSEIKSVNFAFAIGAGVQWTAGPGRISLDARYRRLLQPFTDGASFFGDPDGETGQAHMIELFAGYAFP